MNADPELKKSRLQHVQLRGSVTEEVTLIRPQVALLESRLKCSNKTLQPSARSIDDDF